jgi:3-hydroxyacyl-CoA dehydrogenase
MSNTDETVTLGIIGCGLIGASWSALAAACGLRVLAWDPLDHHETLFSDRVAKARMQLAQLGLQGSGEILTVATLPEAVVGSDYIQENAPEQLDLKIDLLRAIESAKQPGVIIASSTSSLLWSELADELADPAHFILAHPFNPPHLMPLVEIYGANQATCDRAIAMYQRLGRVPIRLKREARGHIANRLASALWREAVNIVATGIADVADVDLALVNGPGLRWSVIGAHMAYHLGGGVGGIESYLKHLGPSQERRWADLGHPQLTSDIRRLLVDGIATEAAGRSIETLEAQRDAGLIATLQSRQGHANAE